MRVKTSFMMRSEIIRLKPLYRMVPVLVLFLGFAAHAQVPITFQQGLGGYTGTHDTFYQTGDPAAMNGADTAWEWDSSDAGGMNFGCIRFDDIIGSNTGQVPSDAKIQKAVLTLVVTGSGASDQIATMHELLVPFDDTQDFYAFGDGSGAEPLVDKDYVADPIAEIPGPTSGDILELDITDYIKKVQSGGKNYGLIVVPGGSDGVNIASSEAAAANRPKLTVTIEGVAPTAARAFSKAGFLANDAIAVSIQVNLSQGSMDITVVETLPADWSAENISDGGTLASGKITWTLAGFSGSKTLTYTAKAPAAPKQGAIFSGVVNDPAGHVIPIEGSNSLAVIPPLYKTGNVLAVGVWNSDNGSSDLAVSADLSDNNGVIYVQDSSAAGGWPAGTIFRWKVVFYDDGTGAEEPGWRGRDFKNDTEANGWIQQTDAGFTVGHGGNDAENGETLLDSTNETVYTRSIFDAKNYETITQMTLKMAADDESVGWLNGVLIGWTASGTSNRGELAPDYVFDTTISGGSGGLEGGTNPTEYTGGGSRTFTFPVNLADAPPVPVSDWSLF